MPAKIADQIRIKHIMDAISEIESYIKNADFNKFSSDSMMFNATLRQLEVIGEAANKLSEDYLLATSHIPWARIIGLRNLIIHEYFGVDDITIWNIVKINIPSLKSALIEKES